MTMGIVDAFAFDKFGVFTTNQAGNLVVFVSGPWNVGGKAVLAGSPARGRGRRGAGCGSVPVGRRTAAAEPALAADGRRALAVARPDREHLVRPPILAGAGDGGGDRMYGGGWMLAAAPKMWLTANTGAYLAAVTATVYPDGEDADGRRRRFQRTPSRTAAMSTLGFIGGS